MDHRFTHFLYWQSYEAPTTFRVSLQGGWFIFGGNLAFRKQTLYPETRVVVFDAEVGVFIPPITTSGLLINVELHPWVIIRANGLEDAECPYLEECIDQLMEARMAARAKRIAQAGNASTDADNCASGSGNGGVASENDINEGDRDGNSTLDGSHMDDEPDVRIIVVFGGNDGNDPDYIYRSSDEEGSEGEGEVSEEEWANKEEGRGNSEEEEAMETDCDDEAMVERSITDLTWLSDS